MNDLDLNFWNFFHSSTNNSCEDERGRERRKKQLENFNNSSDRFFWQNINEWMEGVQHPATKRVLQTFFRIRHQWRRQRARERCGEEIRGKLNFIYSPKSLFLSILALVFNLIFGLLSIFHTFWILRLPQSEFRNSLAAKKKFSLEFSCKIDKGVTDLVQTHQIQLFFLRVSFLQMTFTKLLKHQKMNITSINYCLMKQDFLSSFSFSLLRWGE